MVDQAKLTDWAQRVRTASTWQSGKYGRMLADLADEIDQEAGTDTTAAVAPNLTSERQTLLREKQAAAEADKAAGRTGTTPADSGSGSTTT